MSIQQQQPMPIVLLKEGTTETKGNQAQRNNITAAKTIAEIVRSSLGPRGMDKMLVNNIGDVTITNDGATILKEIDVQHPAARSEEYTSELQSRQYLVCRLLLEQKKKNTRQNPNH